MKKLTLSILIVGLFCGNAFPFKLGLEFQAGQKMLFGANMRFSDLFELKPQLGFIFSDFQDEFDLVVNGNFYLSDLGQLQQYVGPGINFAFSDETSFGINGNYGLRYDINDALSIFGQVGLGMIFTPDFSIGTYSTGVGLTFYMLNR
ncbi:MAG TPA: hypothetical protein VKY57_01985 [Chitinispirillaceae bacterium]|nr:hypothetical protein [Chitinispirillaceae bacterium]